MKYHDRRESFLLPCIFVNVGVMLIGGVIAEECFGPIEYRDGPDAIFGLLLFVAIFSGVPFCIIISKYKKLLLPLLFQMTLFATITLILNIMLLSFYIIICPIFSTFVMYMTVKSAQKKEERNNKRFHYTNIEQPFEIDDDFLNEDDDDFSGTEYFNK